MKVIVSGPNLKETTFECEAGTKVEDILNIIKDKMPYPIYACRLDNAYRSLTHIIGHDSYIEFLDIRNQATWLIYQNSLILLFIKALHDICGKRYKVSVRNSINKGLYLTTNYEINEETLLKIEKQMKLLV